MQKVVYLPALLASLGLSHAVAQTETGQVLAASCSSCHAAVEGSLSTGVESEIPSLQGYSADQLLQSLIAYREDKVSGTLMNRIAKGYSDEELQAIAHYLTQK